jgi:hypothetical protein
MVEVIERGEPALMLGHWTGIYWNGQELGFHVLQEVVKRLHARFDNLAWMKLSEIARYWAAKELTAITRQADQIMFEAPFACPDFTVRVEDPSVVQLKVAGGAEVKELKKVDILRHLHPGAWHRERANVTACFSLPRGASRLELIR